MRRNCQLGVGICRCSCSPTPHSIAKVLGSEIQDFRHKSSHYAPADKHADETLDRLLGNQWSDAFKVGQPEPESETPAVSMLLGGRVGKWREVRSGAE